MQQVEKQAATPRAQLLALFDVAKQWFMQEDFYGCVFINAVGEHAESDSPVRRVCQQFKTQIRGFIYALCLKADQVLKR